MNLGVRKINGFNSEVLVLGVPDPDGSVVLLSPDRDVAAWRADVLKVVAGRKAARVPLFKRRHAARSAYLLSSGSPASQSTARPARVSGSALPPFSPD